MYSERRLVRFLLDILKSPLVSLDNSAWEFDVGKGIRQTTFGQSKGYPTACRGWQGEIEKIHPPPISS